MASRRRLPWRGDPPPYNGSTAGTNKPDATSAKLETFGIITSAKISTPVSAREVTPYGVWVSEIMCQQTRIEVSSHM